MDKHRTPEEQAMIDLFRARLQATLDKKTMSPAYLSRLSGVSKSMISGYLKGNHEPGQLNTYKMARVLNVSPAWLMGLNGDSCAIMPKKELSDVVCILNDEGQQRLIDYAQGLTASDKYRKAQ